MPRPAKKADDKAKAPVVAAPAPVMAPPPPAANVMAPQVPMAAHMGMPPRVVDNESFLRVRDLAIHSLTTIQELLRSFIADYVRQTNLLLGESNAEPVQADLLSLENAAAQFRMPVQVMAPPVEEKKERKKRTHDPNAPKRPLTPYFLYMQHARSIIAHDLGPEAPKGAVQEEGQRRWAQMGAVEKKGWNAAYQYNLRLYNARVHSYKAGNPLAKNMSDEEALKYADDASIAMPDPKDVPVETPANDQEAIAEQLQQQQQQVEGETKTPKKAGSSRKRKTATPAAEPTPVAETAKATPASPDKKRRRTSAKIAEDKEEPKKSGRKKTKSS
ncbi:hypothetical protein HIM_09014 [Hirsutella minnesotensis 3608]|uniref:HMG box domain-containing protein n=1 Tax=Hirsutella minnesotensis 3608 TaxID=1043627 RepID=A0A0F7ZM06_9HYPO|nr:hypothetical protein HIM_09014 [Hirsutella minnesotensis 3608]